MEVVRSSLEGAEPILAVATTLVVGTLVATELRVPAVDEEEVALDSAYGISPSSKFGSAGGHMSSFSRPAIVSQRLTSMIAMPWSRCGTSSVSMLPAWICLRDTAKVAD